MLKKYLELVCILLSGLTFFAKPAHAILSIGVEPVVGYEWVQKLLPEKHSAQQLTYGARVTVGVLMISAEMEGLLAQYTEDYSTGQKVEDKTYTVRAGARSRIRLSSLLNLVVRAGAQGKRIFTTVTTGSVAAKTSTDWMLAPYGGAGLQVWLGTAFALTGEMVVAFNDFPSMAENEYQTTLGFTVKLK